MVFEAVVVEFLNKFLNQYIENLDTSQLKIGIWGGDVFLNELKIKTTLLDDLNLPVRVKWGKLGRFFMKIPWKNLYSSNVIVEIENLLLVIVPNSELKYDPIKEEKWAQEKKQEKLKAIEEAKKREIEGINLKDNDSFVEKLVTQITKNLQIAIKNVHIRYEDNSTIPGCPFSVGVTLADLSARTTAEDSILKFSTLKQGAENFICKVVNLEGLAIYWNTKSSLYSDLPTKILINILLESIPKRNFKPNGFMYMFGPISVSAFLRLNPKPESSSCNFTIPKIFCNIHLKEIELAVTHHQFSEALKFLQNLQRLSRAVKYKKYRPQVPVRGHTKQWWNFAYLAIVEDISRRRREWNWENIKKHREMCRKYAQLFKMKLNSKKLPQNLLMEFKELERKLNVFNLVLIREQVYVEEERMQKQKEDQSRGWFSGWFGYGSEADANSDEVHLVKKIESVMTSEEKQKLYKAIGYEESAPPTNYPITFVEVQFWFHLEEMKLTVYNDFRTELVPLMTVSVKSVRVEFEQRPSAFAMKFVMTIGKFQVIGKEEADKTFPVLVTSNCKESESLIEILYETKPLHSLCDQRIIVNARPLSVIFHATTLNLVRNVFRTDDSEEMDKIMAATSASLPDFPKITSLGLQYAIEKQVVIELKISIMSSYLVIPYGGVYKPDVDMLVITLGHLSVETLENSRKEVSVKKLFDEGTTGEDIFSAVVSASYTNFICQLKGIQIIFQLSGEDWKETSKINNSSLQFLEPTNLEVIIKKSLVMDDPRIPKIIIEGKLPSITINFSEERFMSFVALALSIPVKTEDENTLAASKKKMHSSNWSIQSLGTQLESKFAAKQSNYYQVSSDYIQGISLVGHFVMSEFRVNVMKASVSGEIKKLSKDLISEEKFLTLRVMKLEVTITKKTFENVNILKLGGIDVKQYLKKKIVPFVATKFFDADHYLFVVEYVTLDSRLPDFYSLRKGILNRLSLNITPLNILLNQEALLVLLTFVTKLQNKIALMKENSGCQWESTGVVKTKEFKETESSQIGKRVIGKGRTFRKKRFQKETIDLYLDANLDELDIVVEFQESFESKGLAEFNVKGGNVSLSTRKSGTALDMNIREVLLLDLNPLTEHKKIVASLEEQTLSCRLTVYNKEYFGSENDLDGSVDAEVGRIQLTFVHHFFNRATVFLRAFHFQDTLKETASLAAQKAKDNMIKAFQNDAQICVNIKITAPFLIFPKSSTQMEAIILDMGVLTLKNSISEVDYSSEKQITKNPVVDTLGFSLQNLKATRCILIKDTEVESEVTFIVPVSFDVTVKRNLSHIWFKLLPKLDIYARLGRIVVTLSHGDLCVITQIIHENLNEGAKPCKSGNSTQFPKQNREKRLSSYQFVPNERQEEEKKKRKEEAEEEEVEEEEKEEVVVVRQQHSSENFYATVKFRFVLESFVFDARFASLNEGNEEDNHLAKFVLEAISIKGRLFSNDCIQTSLILGSCLLNDMRPGREGGLTRLMERTPDPNIKNFETEQNSTKSMVEVLFQKNQTDNFVDIRVYKFTLVLSMDFLQKLSEFFTLKQPTSDAATDAISDPTTVQKVLEKNKVAETEDKDIMRRPSYKTTSINEINEENNYTYTINLRLEKPDIIFVENIDSINTDALIFHTEIIVKYRFYGSKKIITATFTDIELYSCCFNPDKRPQTLSQVIKPFTISIAGSTPEHSGLHIDVCSTDLKIVINPFTVDLISKCCAAFLKDSSVDESNIQENVYSDLWKVRPFDINNYWFMKPEQGLDSLELIRSASSFKSIEGLSTNEICLLALPSIKIFVEGVSSGGTHPMILLEMGFQMQCYNWSQKLSITSSLAIEATYYNQKLSLWEPIIERIEKLSGGQRKDGLKVWELFCYVNCSDEGELDEMRPPKVQVTLTCEEALELCFTKTSVQVLTSAVEIYTKAVKRQTVVSTFFILPPVVVKNETEVPAEILLDESELRLWKNVENDQKVILLEPDCEVELCHLNSDRSTITGEQEPRIYVRFPMANNHIFELRSGSSGKRCYPFPTEFSENDFRYLLTNVLVMERTTTVFLRSPIRVVNYFNEAINIHFLSDGGKAAEYAGTVDGNSKFYMPFHAVYSEEKAFYFSVNGYSLSDEPFVWQNSDQVLDTSILVQCTSEAPENGDPFFIQVSGEAKSVFFANTKQKTTFSVEYIIHLQPTLKIFNSLPVPLVFHFQGRAMDKTLQPGHHMQITNAEPGLSSITLRISNYLEKEWSCKEIFQENPSEFMIWDFVSYNGLAPETLTLGVYVTYVKKTAVYAIYSPYFTVNKTELLLAYRFENGENVFYQPGDFRAPLMLSTSGKKFFSKKSLFLQVNSSSWSQKFPIDVAGMGGVVDCEDINSGITYRISVTITLTYNSLTKIVLFTPFYNLLNLLKYTIEWKESDFPKSKWEAISPGSCTPFWPRSNAIKKALVIKPENSNSVTPSFNYDTTDACLLRLSDEYGAIFVNIKSTPSGNCIMFTAYEPGQAPVLIINHSSKDVTLHETGTSFSLTLKPSEEVFHAWVEPTGERSLTFMSVKNTKHIVSLDQDEEGLISTAKGEPLRYVSFLEGTQRILILTEDSMLSQNISTIKTSHSGIEVIFKIQGIGISLVNNITRIEVLYMTLSSSGISWEAKKLKKRKYKKLKSKEGQAMEEMYQKYLESKEVSLNSEHIYEVTEGLRVDFLEMKILEPNFSDLRRTYEPGFYLAFRQIDDQIMLHVKFNRIQIDNQLQDCIFPVVLAPLPAPKTIAASDLVSRPFVELSIVKVIDPHSGTSQFKYFKTLVQAFSVQVDIGFLHELFEFLASKPLTDEENLAQFQKDMEYMEKALRSHVEIITENEQKIFYEIVHFSPLKIHFSFSLAGNFDSNRFLPQKIGVLVQSIGVTLTDVNDVIIRLAYLEKKREFLTKSELWREVTSHYYSQIIKQAHVLLLGLDVIGNPYGLIVGIGEGVEAFFYEPFQGMIQGPSEFGKGMAIGCKSLFGHTVGSAAGTLGKLTGTLGKGLAVLSLDKEYQKQRMMDQHRNEDIHASMARGGKGLFMGVVEGVRGVVQKPIKGAKEEGIGGFFKGMGKGMMGLVTRPVSGVVDFASTSFNAVNRASKASLESKRVRPPRFFRDEYIVQPYSLIDAEGNAILKLLAKQKFSTTDKYDFHLQLNDKEVVLLTNKRIIFAELSEMFGTWQVHLEVPWNAMPEPPFFHTKGVALSFPGKIGSLKKEKPEVKVLLIADECTKQEICKKMIKLYEAEKDNLEQIQPYQCLTNLKA